jgi:hypothetical protein
LASCCFSVSSSEDKTKRPPSWHNWGDWGRIADDAKRSHRTRLPECILKMTEALGTVDGDYFKGNWGL